MNRSIEIQRQRRAQLEEDPRIILYKRKYSLFWMLVNAYFFVMAPHIMSCFTWSDNEYLKNTLRFFLTINIVYHLYIIIFKYRRNSEIRLNQNTSPTNYESRLQPDADLYAFARLRELSRVRGVTRVPVGPVRKWEWIDIIDRKKLNEERMNQMMRSLCNTANSSGNEYLSFGTTDEDKRKFASWTFRYEPGVLFLPSMYAVKRCSCPVVDWRCRLCPFRAYPHSFFKSWFWYPVEYAAKDCLECGQSCFITSEEYRQLKVTSYPLHWCDCKCRYCTFADKEPLKPRINLLPDQGHCSCICQKCRIIEELIQGLEPHEKQESPDEDFETAEDFAAFTEEDRYFQCWSPPQRCNRRSPAAVLKNLVHRFSPAENANSFTGVGRSLHISNELLKNFGVNPLNYINWTSNIRQWISSTILKRIVDEMKKIDDELISQGLTLVSVGHVGYDALRATAYSEQISKNVPTLILLLPFLEISSNQLYIVQRIKELAVGNTMKEFAGQSGGQFDNKPWDAHLPSDSELIMHQILTYLDGKLPPLINEPLKRPFSTQYFSKYPIMPPQTKLAIYQQGIIPPHYNLIVNNEIHQIPAGSNNVFFTLLLFIHCIKMNYDGMLGRINLGPAGLNMLWIVEDTTRI